MKQDKNTVIVHDLMFQKYIDKQEISRRVRELGLELNALYVGKTPVVLGVLNGAMIFMSDLIRTLDFSLECRFLRTSSYSGTMSLGVLKVENPEVLDLKGRDVIIVEDIVDSGFTMNGILQLLSAHEPASVRVVTFLHKPEASKVEVTVDFTCFSIPDRFVVGYGLDYNGLGRNFPDLYQLAESQ
jgi:hypoxanthine phosphoribosyltransferase